MLKVAKFKGGLGNQLFQYTFLLNLKRICSREVIKGDFSYYKNLRGDNIRVPRIKELSIDIDEATNDDLQEVLLLRHNSNPKTLTYKAKVFLEKMLNKEYFFEPDRRYRAVNDLACYSYFDGYWQSWMYVDSVEDKLKREIRLRKVFSDKTKRTIERIQTENAVMLCIRRGDYVATYRSRKHYGTLGTEYYSRAIQYILERVEHPIFYAI